MGLAGLPDDASVVVCPRDCDKAASLPPAKTMESTIANMPAIALRV
jgi:hypothetical protein